MAKATVELYLKEKVKEYLKTIEAFEKKHLADREEFITLQQKIQMFKANNPDSSYEAVKEELIRLQEVHYWSFLLEQNMKHELVKTKELITLSDILGIDFELEGDDNIALQNIRTQDSDMFQLDKDGEVILVDNSFKPQLEGALNSAKTNVENLKVMYSNVPLPKTM